MLEAIDRLLPSMDGAREVRFAAFEDGPPHRRAASSVLGAALMRVLEEAARSRGVEPRAYDGDSVDVDWSLPPHMRHRRRGPSYSSAPIPTRLLASLCADEREREDIIQALSEGPEHDVATNVVLLNMLESLYDIVSDGRAPSASAAPQRPAGRRDPRGDRAGVDDTPRDRRDVDLNRAVFWRPGSSPRAGFHSPPRDVARPGRREPTRPAPVQPVPIHPAAARRQEPQVPAEPVRDEHRPAPVPDESSVDPKHSRSVFDWGFRFKLWKIKNGKNPRTPE